MEGSKKVLECNLCEMSFASRQGRIDHVELIHKGNRYTCHICPKQFKRKYYLKTHLTRIHSTRRPHTCKVCSKSFKLKGDLDIHHKRIHLKDDAKRHECEMCGKKFHFLSLLTKHIRTHLCEKYFKCDLCLKAFKSMQEVKIHMKIHSREKPNACETCGKTFTHKSSLITHRRIHTGEKPFTCRTCKKSFAQISQLTQHKLNLHQKNLKPFGCVFCERRFSNQTKFFEHLRSHNDEKADICHICSKELSASGNLARHLKQVHGMKKRNTAK